MIKFNTITELINFLEEDPNSRVRSDVVELVSLKWDILKKEKRIRELSENIEYNRDYINED